MCVTCSTRSVAKSLTEDAIAMDISADLLDLRGRRVALVCAGVKSILDIGRYVSCHLTSIPSTY